LNHFGFRILDQLRISDPTQVFDVEVNLDERSRGLRWFFSFYITFSADTNGGAAKNAILLLDEPGLFLHIESQKDLQSHFEQDFDNQILYTTQGRSIRDEMLKSRLLRDEQVILVSEAFDSAPPSEADIEDLLDPSVFEDLVRDSYSKELQGKTLTLNSNIPRIVKRFEEAFRQEGLTFHKTRTAGLFFRRMTMNPTSLMIGDSTKRFDRLFTTIKARLQKTIARGNDPFH